jgi:glycosyltransferase involved in cell wall biosynthesis
MKSDRVEVSFVMPCLNEEQTLPQCIAKARRAIEQHGLCAEIVIADNGSTDGSARIAEELGARVVPVRERGYGAALMGGITAARGEYVIMGDADDSYDWSAVFPFIERLRANDDFVFGCRLPAGGGTILPGAMPWQNRWIGNPALTAIGRLFFGAPVSDFHCGLRAFRKTAFEALNLGRRAWSSRRR